MTYSKIVRKVVREPLDVQPRVVAVGVDLSLRGTGVAVVEDGKLAFAQAWTDVKKMQQRYPHRLCWFKMKENTEAARVHRLALVADWVMQQVFRAQPAGGVAHVALEGYAFSKRTTGLSDIHELGGMLKGKLWANDIPFRTYDPMSIKLYWTGSGTAEKPDMVKAAGRRFAVLALELPGMLEESEDAAGNVADAALIAALLYEELKVKAGLVPLDGMPERQRRVMLRVTKHEPEALTTRAFIEKQVVSAPEPILPACST